MKNDYEVRGDTAVILLDKRDGTQIECLIDITDLEKVKSFPNKWLDCWSPGGRTHYVRGNTRINGMPTSVIFTRYLLDAPKGMQVDHINHNTLDNRRKNLRIVTPLENGQNKKGAFKNSKSGVRNVVWQEDMKKWRVQITLKGKTYSFGAYNNLEEAKKVAKKVREENMPFSQDGMKARELI